MRRNTAYYLFKAAQAATTALIAMSVFFRSTLSPGSSVRDGELYLAALYFIVIMNMLVVLSEMAVTIQRLPVFYKQRDALFYPAWAYVLPSCLLRLPMSLYESLIWISLTYFTIGSFDKPHWYREEMCAGELKRNSTPKSRLQQKHREQKSAPIRAS